MKIRITSIPVDDQEKAIQFYTGKLGFVKKNDVPVGDFRWLTVVSPGEEDGIELLLEPIGFEPARVYQQELHKAGIPYTSFVVEDMAKEQERLLAAGVVFQSEPMKVGDVVMAVIDDTCGNLLQLVQP